MKHRKNWRRESVNRVKRFCRSVLRQTLLKQWLDRNHGWSYPNPPAFVRLERLNASVVDRVDREFRRFIRRRSA